MRNISFASVPFFLEYEEPLTNSISVQQISRSAPCNISFATVPFISEYEEPLTNSISVQQISRSAPCNKEASMHNITYNFILQKQLQITMICFITD